MNNSSFDIQKAVVEELKELYKDDTFMTPSGTERALNFYRQEIPEPQDDDEEVDPELISVPYCLVKLLDGSFDEWNYTRKVGIAVVFCIYDHSKERAGHEKIMDLIDKAYKHFAENPWIKNSHIELPMEWTIQTDMDTFPFYFGAFSLNLESGGAKIPQNDLT